jgi:hypothetical protein
MEKIKVNFQKTSLTVCKFLRIIKEIRKSEMVLGIVNLGIVLENETHLAGRFLIAKRLNLPLLAAYVNISRPPRYGIKVDA